MDKDDSKDKSMSHDFAFRRFSSAKRAAGGIKAQMKRGRNAAETWWGRRWIQVLESFDIGARLDRGRSYARKGQVLSIDVSEGQVLSRVQGSRSDPYRVSIDMTVLTDSEWQLIIKAFASKALYLAKLLARQMPPQVEEVFADQGLSLFPDRKDDLHTNCSCPDWSNPCKHIAAVYYLLGEEFDRDPFLIFTVRGLSEEKLMSALDSFLVDSKKSKVKTRKRRGSEEPVIIKANADESSASDSGRVGGSVTADFWRTGSLPPQHGELRLPERNAALARNLGNFPFWRGQEDFWSKLDDTYKRASLETLKLLSE